MAANLELVITAKDNASGALSSIDKKAGGLASSFSSLGKMAAVGAGVGIAAAGAAAIKFIGVASDLNEVSNKATVVFGDSSKAVSDFAASSAKSFGIAKVDALGYASTLGVILKGSGIAEGATADMSVGLTKLAADMASFNNIPIDVALEKIRAGLVGESEPLRTVGVLLSEAAVQEEAYSSGIAKRGEKLTDAQKVQARYNLIQKQTSDQQGDFERTSGSLANRLRILGAEWKDLQAIIGNLLLPIVTEVAGFLVNNLPTAIDTAKTAARELRNEFADHIQPVLEDVGRILKEDVIPVFEDIFGKIDGFVGKKAEVGAALGAVAVLFGAIALSAGAAAVSVGLAVWPVLAVALVGGVLIAALITLDEKTHILSDTFNNVLVPAFNAIKDWLDPKLKEASENLTQLWNTNLVPAANDVAKVFREDVLPALKDVWSWLEEKIFPTIEKFFEFLRRHPVEVGIAVGALALLSGPTGAFAAVVVAGTAMVVWWDSLKIKFAIWYNEIAEFLNRIVRAVNSVTDKEVFGVRLGPHLPEQELINIGKMVGHEGQGMGENIGMSPINERALGGVTIQFNSVVPAGPAEIQRAKGAIESILRS